ncbi:MAG TPA: hypothetical protein G4O16_00230, partial [Dehalococcoidia bacterium]|nr:hypothetical protein [Dehalococcoidia bacterium]
VLLKQSEEIRDFLLKTSVLEWLSDPLCDAVTGRNDSRDVLLNLERGQLFIVPLDESRQWYRYEHLFADLLRHQCQTAYGIEKIATLHRQASQWYEDNNLPDDAIYHILTAQDWDRAVVLIIEHGEKKRQRGEFMTLFHWLQRLPEQVILSHPQLSIDYIQYLSMAGQVKASEAILKNLEKVTEDDDSFKGTIYALQAQMAWRRHDYPLVEKLAKKALSLFTAE